MITFSRRPRSWTPASSSAISVLVLSAPKPPNDGMTSPPVARMALIVPEPITISLQDAMQRARKFGAQVQAADIAAQLLKEDVKQAKAARLPTVNGLNQFIYTEGNGTPSGVYAANDGVHVYNEQLTGHADLLGFLRSGPVRLAEAAEAAARAKADVAARGLNATVIQDYYSLADDLRRVANAQQSLKEARQFLDITRNWNTAAKLRMPTS